MRTSVPVALTAGLVLVAAPAVARDIEGGPYRDVVHGTAKRDTIRTHGGDDVIVSHESRDRVYGGTGRDRIVSGKQGDLVRGGSGGDTISPGPGKDVVLAMSGNDRIIVRDDGKVDHLRCGRGRDVVEYRRAVDAKDRFYGCERFHLVRRP